MMKKLNFSVRDIVQKRISVRTYDKRAVPQKVRDELLSHADRLENPLGPKIRIQRIEKEAKADGEKAARFGTAISPYTQGRPQIALRAAVLPKQF